LIDTPPLRPSEVVPLLGLEFFRMLEARIASESAWFLPSVIPGFMGPKGLVVTDQHAAKIVNPASQSERCEFRLRVRLFR